MNTRILCLLALASLAVPLFAQQPELPPLPPGPLINRAPSYSTWRVTFQGQPAGDKKPASAPATGEAQSKDNKEKEAPSLVSTVIKTGSTIVEQNVDAEGRQKQVWHASGFRIVLSGSTPMVCPDYGGQDIFSLNFASSDFAGFSWLSPSTYAGLVKFQGNDCIFFKGTVSPLTEKEQADEIAYITQARALGYKVPDPLKVPALAYIDLKSRLPLYAQYGNQKRIYQYGVPPQNELHLPVDVGGTLNHYEQKLKRLSAGPARAY